MTPDQIQSFLMTQLAVSSILIPITVAFTQLAKSVGLPVRVAPVATLVFGIGLQFLATAAFSVEQRVSLTLFLGIIVGLSASGLYSGVKATVTTAPSQVN